MRILHCTDFHGNGRWFDWLVRLSPGYDLVCLTGDLLDLFEIHKVDDQLRMVKAALRRVTVPLALCSGNHDSFSGPPAPPSLQHAAWLDELRRPDVWIDGDTFKLGGLRFHCVGWNAQLPIADPVGVWLYHAPPSRSPVAHGWDGSEAGDEILHELCVSAERSPSLVLSGHQHNPRRWVCCVGKTWCLNPGYNRHATDPNHIIIDTSAQTVSLRTSEGELTTVKLEAL